MTVWLSVFGDVLHLKDGTRVRRAIPEATEATVTIVTANGTATHPMSSVSYIEREGPGTIRQAPTGIKQQQQSGESLGSSLSYEQEWNNAVYYAKEREGVECTRNWVAAVSLWGCGVIGVVFSGYILLTEAIQIVPVELRFLVDTALSISIALFPLGYLVLTSSGPNTIWCEKAHGETARLEAIGRQKGWTYLGRLIGPPTLTAEVIVKKEDSVVDWILFFSGLED